MCLKDFCGSIYVFLHMVCVVMGYSQSSTDVLWPSCDTVVCGKPRLNIQCNAESKILINNATLSLEDVRANANSYSNLRRICMGLSTCNTVDFCNQYQAHINVSYTCVKDKDVDKSCKEDATFLTAKSGFISSLNYPSETKFRKCRWMIQVKPGQLIHIFLHEILPISTAVSPDQCSGGLLFATNNTCGQHFPTDPICNEVGKNTTITACSDVEILLSGNSDSDSMRFWLSYYVVQRHLTHFPQLQQFALYDVDITCNVNAKEEFVYKYNQINPVTGGETYIDATHNTTTIFQPSHEIDSNVDYVTYISLAVGLLVFAVVILIIALFIRFRLAHGFAESKDIIDSPGNLSKSDSPNGNVPLPETEEIKDLVIQSELELQQEYSSVVDVLPHPTPPPNSISPTYAEIEEYSETGEIPKVVLANKKSIDNSKRELPAKPNEDTKLPIYCDIEDSYANDEKIQKQKEKNLQENRQEKCYNDYSHKKFSNASNVYDECVDISSNGHAVTYINMSHKCMEDSEYVTNTESFKGVPRSKTSKNETNLSNSQVVGKITNNYILKANEIIVKGETLDQNTGKGVNVAKLKVKNDSITSNSDSDDEICMIENDLYEPFESAKV